MTAFVISTNTTTPTALASNDEYLLLPNVSHTSTAGEVIDESDIDRFSIGIFGFMASTQRAAIEIDGTSQDGFVQVGATGVVTTTNSFWAIELEVENLSFINAGSVSGAGAVWIRGADADIINSGTLIAETQSGGNNFATLELTPGATDANINNSGSITGTIGITARSDSTIVNSGVIQGNVDGIVVSTFAPADTLTISNSGTIAGGSGVAIENTRSINDLLNTGTILGDVVFGARADAYVGVNDGFVAGSVFAGSGADMLIGSNANDVFLGEAGADTLSGNAGNDTIDGGDDADVIRGGDGADSLLGGTGNDTIRAGGGDDEVSGEDDNDDLRGSGGNDTLNGQNGDDILRGGSDDDVLNGGDGFDRLFGDNGDDEIFGGLNRDVLYGGKGADTFIYNSADDSTNAETDGIRDFRAGEDIIDLSATTGLEMIFNDTSGFLGGGTASVYYNVNSSDQAILRADVDGDGVQDIKIKLFNVTELTADDFLL